MKIFSRIFSLICIAITFFSFSVSIVQAQVSSRLQPSSGFFNVTFSQACADSTSGVCQIGWIGEYISAVYNYGVALAAVLAVVAIMVGGFIWLSSAGSPDKVKSGQNIISGALTGLVLALFSFVILQTVNPRLVALEPLQINVIDKVESASDDNRAIKTICVGIQSSLQGALTELSCYQAAFQAGISSTAASAKYYNQSCSTLGNLCPPSVPESYGCCVIVPADAYGAPTTEDSTRSLLAPNVTVNKSACVEGQTTNCTNVGNLHFSAIRGLIDLAKIVGPIVITGGTESGHSSHGPGKAIVDLRPTPSLSAYIENEQNSVKVDVEFGSKAYRIGNDLYVNEGNHWHVEFNSNRF